MPIPRARIGLRLAALALSLAIGGGAAHAETGTPPENADFETGKPGETPAGWKIPTPGATASLSDASPAEGKLCAELANAAEQRFSNLMQSFDATEYRGKRIELSASVRCDAGDDKNVQMWLRVDRQNSRRGFFDNMHERPIRSGNWATYTIRGDIEDDAQRINIGFMLFGVGARAWADGVSVRIIGPANVGEVPPSPLTDRGLANLVAFTRLVGVVRFFHPTTEAEKIDWDDYTIRALQDIESADSREQLIEKLTACMSPVAPTVQIWAGAADAGSAPLTAPAGAGFVIANKHTGYATPGKEGPNVYSSERVKQKLPAEDSGLPAPGTAVVIDLGDGVRARVPVALYADKQGTLPRATGQPPAGPARPDGWKPSNKDRLTRLAAVMQAWNVINHFYPYFDVVDTDWVAALPPALRKAATDKAPEEFYATLATMQHDMHDGHGYLSGPGESNFVGRTFDWDWVGPDLVITAVPDSLTALHRGDIVREIDGRSVDDLYREAASQICAATEQWRRDRALTEIGWTGSQGTVILKVQRDGQIVAADIPRYSEGNRAKPPQPGQGDEVAPGLVYFDLNAASVPDLMKVMPAITAAKGVIFDLRGYPGGAGSSLLPHLTDTVITSARWMIPVITMPNFQNVRFNRSNWILQPAGPRITGQVAFLTGGGAVSYAESCMGIVEHYKLGDIVGSPTAGTNGNITAIELPGGYSYSFTGMQVLKNDGSRHHGVGIQPTVPVKPTVAGIAAGRDEVLEKAIEVLQAKIDFRASEIRVDPAAGTTPEK